MRSRVVNEEEPQLSTQLWWPLLLCHDEGATLLWFVKSWGAAFEESVEVAGEVAGQAAFDLAAGLALGGAVNRPGASGNTGAVQQNQLPEHALALVDRCVLWM